MLAIALLAALCGQTHEGPRGPDSIPLLAVEGDTSPWRLSRLTSAEPPAPPAPRPGDDTASDPAGAAGPNARIVGLIYQRLDQRLDRIERDLSVALNQPSKSEAVTLPVNPPEPPPAPAAPAKPSPQMPPAAAVQASPQMQALTAPVPTTLAVAAVPAGPVYPGPLRRVVGWAGEQVAHVGQPRVYLARQPRPRMVRVAQPAVAAPAAQVVYVPVAQAPVVQPAPPAPGKGGY